MRKDVPEGTDDPKIPIKHILVLMQENRSFDSYLGALAHQGYEGQVDGISDKLYNLDPSGTPIPMFHQKDLCVANPKHRWDDEHFSWNNGKLDQFVKRNGRKVMGYFDRSDLPFYYALANQFAVADRYFCSSLTQTFPNRFFLYAATAFGTTANSWPISFRNFHLNDLLHLRFKRTFQYDQPTIFDLLDKNHIRWKYYTDDHDFLSRFRVMSKGHHKVFDSTEYEQDLRNNSLPQVTFLDSAHDEHPPQNIQLGQEWVAKRIHSLIKSSSWRSSALFLTYDENGGFYDHVPPPHACIPDSKPPLLSRGEHGAYDRYGFRVPFILISPFAKHHFVSHTVYDHTSILKFIETKFNLPALTKRDANANDMLDLFDFQHPTYTVKRLPSGEHNRHRFCGVNTAASSERLEATEDEVDPDD